MLTVIGSYNQDLFFSADQAPVAGETVLGELRLAPGGKGFNQAIAAARMGAKVTFIGALGEDTFAQGAKSLAKQESVDARWETCENYPTGSACILLEADGTNRIVVAPGANAELSTQHVQNCSDALAASKLILAQGEVNPEAVKLAFQMAPKAVHMLNPAPVGEWMAGLLPTTDILTPNETELASMLAPLGITLEPTSIADMDPKALGQLCARLGPKHVVVTLGRRGCFLFDAASGTAEPSNRFVPVPQTGQAVVDTTGAGDCLSGALAAGLVNGLSIADALAQAVLAATLSVTRHGAAPAMPRLHELSASAAP